MNLRDPDRAAPYYRDAANLDIGVAKRTIDTLLERVQSHPAASVEAVLLDILAAVGRTDTLIAYLRSLGHAAETATEAVDYFLRAARAAIDGTDEPSISRQLLVAAHRRANDDTKQRVLDLAAQHQHAWPADEVVAALRAMLLVENGRGTDAVDALLKASVHNFEPETKGKVEAASGCAFAGCGRSTHGCDQYSERRSRDRALHFRRYSRGP